VRRGTAVAMIGMLSSLGVSACSGTGGRSMVWPDGVESLRTGPPPSASPEGASEPSAVLPVLSAPSDPDADVLASAIGDFLASERWYLAVVRGLPDADPESLRAFASGAVADRWIAGIERWRRAGWRVAPGPLGIDRTVVERGRRRPDGAVEVESCTASDGILFRPGPVPGERVVLDDVLATVRRRVVLVRGPTGWQRTEVEEVSWQEGADRCGA